MNRWAMQLQYRGSAYCGWQAQSHADSVQAHLEHAIAEVADHPVSTIVAGRTDAGVHAAGQLVHFDSAARRNEKAWVFGVNAKLPDDISVRRAQVVNTAFSARFSAVARSYRYLIYNHRARNALLHQAATWISWPLDVELMHQAAQCLLGERDFSAFRSAECQSRTPMRNLMAICVRRQRDFVVIDVRANAFLHHMVRNIAGSLLDVGSGRRPPAWLADVLQSRDRSRAGMTAPAWGLYFLGPHYPAEFGLPEPEEFFLP